MVMFYYVGMDTGAMTDGSGSNSDSVGIIGGAVGGVILLLMIIVVLCIVILCVRRSHRKKELHTVNNTTKLKHKCHYQR